MPRNRISSRRSPRPARLRVEELEKRELLDTSGVLSLPKIVEKGAPPPSFDHSALVTGLYLDLLHRQPGPTEVAGWSSAINSGMSSAQVAAAFVNSDEYHAVLIRQDYETLLRREPDAAGLQAWIQNLRHGLTPQQTAAAFAASDEYFLDQGGSVGNWVNALYRDLLGRTADPGGLVTWLRIVQGGAPRYAVALKFTTSHEGNNLLVTNAYEALLGRVPDAGAAGWVAAIDTGMPLSQFLAGVASSAEYLKLQQGTDFTSITVPNPGTPAPGTTGVNNQSSRFIARTQSKDTLTVGPSVDVNRETGDQTEVTVAVDPNNSQRVFVASNENNITFGMMASYTTDGGATWTSSVLGTGPLGDGLPGAFTDPWATWDEFGNLFFSYMTMAQSGAFQLVILMSTDGGKSFTVASQGTTIFDHPEIAAANGVVACTFSSTQNESIHVLLASDIGLGQVGLFGVEVVPNSNFKNLGDIAIGPAGQIMVTYQSTLASTGPGPDQAFVSVNPDPLGTGHFSNPTVAASVNVGNNRSIPAQPARGVKANLDLAYDRSNGPHRGRAYLTYSDAINTTTNNLNVFVRYSDDDGKTWSAPVQVNDDAGKASHFMPKIAVDQSTGNVAVAWYDTRNDPGSGPGDRDHKPNTDAETFATVSTDGGQTFLPNVQVASGPSNAVLDADAFGNDYGDYMGLGYSHGIFYAGWADNSTTLTGNPNRPNFDVAVAAITGPGAATPPNGNGNPSNGGTTPFVPLPPDAYDPNETSDQAFSFGVLTAGAQTIPNLQIARLPNGLVDNNWWRWQAGQAGTFTVEIDYTPFTTGDLQLRLFTLDAQGHLVPLASSRATGVTSQSVSVAVSAGEPLLAWVYGFNHAEASYQMTFSLA